MFSGGEGQNLLLCKFIVMLIFLLFSDQISGGSLLGGLSIKIKQQDSLRDGKNISDSIASFTRLYMICLTFPFTS